MKSHDKQSKVDLKLLHYDMQSMTERWLRVENKYDSVQSELKRLNIKADVMIILQLFIAILLGAVI